MRAARNGKPFSSAQPRRSAAVVVGTSMVAILALAALSVRLQLFEPAGHEGKAAEPQDLLTVRSALATELASHANDWPQRPVTVGAYLVMVPFGPRDPAGYKEWLNNLPLRFGGRITRVYVSDAPGVPTQAELETVKRDVSAELRERQPGPALMIGLDLDSGSVFIRHAPTQDPEFLAALARVEAAYGRLIRVAIDTAHFG